MLLTVIDVSAPKTGVGKQSGKEYQYVELEYEANGATKKKMVNQYADYFDIFKAALPDQQFSVTVKKNGKFYDWTHVETATSSTRSGNGAEHTEVAAQTEAKRIQKTGYQARPASSFETPEERAARQELIVRQSSLERALQYLVAKDIKPDLESVLDLAKDFRDWVYQVGEPETPRVE